MLDRTPVDIESVLRKTQIDMDAYLEMCQEASPYLREHMEKLQQAVESGDKESTISEAHAIKGTSAIMGMTYVRSQAETVELVGRGVIESDPEQELQELSREFSQAMEFLEQVSLEKGVEDSGQ